jgi:hypothetical protein
MPPDPGSRLFHRAPGIFALDSDVQKQEGRRDRPAGHGEREVIEESIQSHRIALEKVREMLNRSPPLPAGNGGAYASR